MSSPFTVVVPRGNLGDIEQAAGELNRYADLVGADGQELHRAAQAISAAWLGAAGTQFDVKAAQADRAVAAISYAQRESSSLLTTYAKQLDKTRKTSSSARCEIDDALSTYGTNARKALQDLASHITAFLEAATPDILEWMLAPAHRIRDLILAWRPPAQRASSVVSDLRDAAAHTADNVLAHLQSGVEWGVSHLLQGIHAIADMIGGAIHALIRAVHWVEEQLAKAIATAQDLVRKAVTWLFELAMKVVMAIADLIAEVARVIFKVLAAVVEMAVDFAVGVGGVLKTAAHWAEQIAVTLAATHLVVMRRLTSPREGRRIKDATKKDDAAVDRWATDRDYQRRVDEMRYLSGSAYDGEGAPEGWTRLESRDGPAGAYVVVYRNNETNEVVVAFRGSQGPKENFDARDWLQDAVNAAGLTSSAQGRFAVAFAREMAAKYPGVTFTGHSLGGSLAAMASVATGAEATTFNAAGIGDGNYAYALQAGGGVGGSEAQITNYSTANDALTLGQMAVGVHPAAGSQVYVASNTTNPIDAHGLDAFDFGSAEPAYPDKCVVT